MEEVEMANGVNQNSVFYEMETVIEVSQNGLRKAYMCVGITFCICSSFDLRVDFILLPNMRLLQLLFFEWLS